VVEEPHYDVIIIGTGAGGGTLAHRLAPTGKRVEIRYMDFWKVVDGRIADNWVSVDFAHVMQQLGVDPFQGQGWEAFDRGERVPPRPVTIA